MKDLDTNATPPRLPFSPYTPAGLAVAIDREAMRYAHAVQHGHVFDPAIRTAAVHLHALCVAHTDRALAFVAESTGAAA